MVNETERTREQEMTVTVERGDTGHLAITLARPKQRNAITVAMYAALADAVESAAGDPSVRVITIEGEARIHCRHDSMLS